MLAHTRAMIAAAAYAFIRRKKVAGLHDHSTGRDLDIAAEARGNQLQGLDGDRSVKFGGTLPELHDVGDKTFVSMTIEGASARGYDRGASTHYAAEVTERRVQLYDYGESAWITFDVQEADAAPEAQART
jgi:hypothetical protein